MRHFLKYFDHQLVHIIRLNCCTLKSKRLFIFFRRLSILQYYGEVATWILMFIGLCKHMYRADVYFEILSVIRSSNAWLLILSHIFTICLTRSRSKCFSMPAVTNQYYGFWLMNERERVVYCCSALNPRPHLLFHLLDRTWRGGGVPYPCLFAP